MVHIRTGKALSQARFDTGPQTCPEWNCCGSAVGRLWGDLDRYPLRGVVVAQERPGTLGGGLDVVAVRGEAAPTPQAHRTAPYRPRYSLDPGMGMFGVLDSARCCELGNSFCGFD